MIIGIAFALSGMFSLVTSLLPDDFDRMHDQAVVIVGESIGESARADEAGWVLGRIRDSFRRALERAAPLNESFWEVDSDYGSTREDYEAAVAEMTGAWRGASERHVARRVELAGHFTPEEWDRFYAGMESWRAQHPLGW